MKWPLVIAADLVKTESVDPPAEVDPGRTDTVDTGLLQSVLCVHCAYSHGGGEGGGDHDGDDVKTADESVLPRLLDIGIHYVLYIQ